MNARMLIVVLVAAMVGSASAGLWTVDNPSFESVEDGGTPGGWGYIIDDWYESETPDMWANFYEQASGIGLAGDGIIWVGTETGGKFYQVIGLYGGEETVNVTMLIGNRWGTSFKTGSISLFVGGDEADAADAVDLVTIAGVALADTINVTTADGTLVSTDVYEVSVNLSTGTGATIGDLVWLEIGSVDGKDYFDHVRAIPEPASLCLLGLGGLAMIRRKRA